MSRGTDIAALYDQETERELAEEVENRIEEALSAIDPGRVVMADLIPARLELEGRSAPALQTPHFQRDRSVAMIRQHPMTKISSVHEQGRVHVSGFCEHREV